MERILQRIISGSGRRADLDLLLEVGGGISAGLRWPPVMTTICPLGPSAVSPIVSIMTHFRDEVAAMIPEGVGSGG